LQPIGDKMARYHCHIGLIDPMASAPIKPKT
jgi:hypothetical protein